MKLLHSVFAALCTGSLLLAGTGALAQDREQQRDRQQQQQDRQQQQQDRQQQSRQQRDEDRVSLGIAVTERDGRLVIAHVIKDLPADEAGLRRGDEIRSVDGERVRNAREFLSRLEGKEEGDEIELEVSRDGETETYDIELASYRDMREAAREDDEYRERIGQMRAQVGQRLGQFRDQRQDQRQQMRGQDQQGGGQELQQLRQQVQELQRQVRQMQSQLQQRDGQQFGQQRFDQQRGGQQQFGQQRDDRGQLGAQYSQRWDDRGQQWDDRGQQYGQQQWDDRGFGQQRGADRQQQQQQYRGAPFR